MRWNSLDTKDAPVGGATTRFLRPGLFAAMAVGVGLALATSDTPTLKADNDAPHVCSNRTLRGDYGFAIDGTVVVPSPAPSLLVRGLAMQRFDGHGEFTQVDFVTLNGVPSGSDWRPATGTYEVNPDCTGAAVINFNDGSPSLNLRLVVVDDGRRIMTVVEGIAAGSTGIKVR